MTLIELNAGPLQMAFDADIAFLRYVRLGDQELIRGVFAAVRDHNWDTIPYSIDELKIEQSADSFSISFIANSLQPEVSFAWNGTIEGNSSGVVQYRFSGTANAPFYRNRIGLCVLHPSSTSSGKPCQVDHVDGSIAFGQFPKFVSPNQPFKNIRSITQHVEPNMQVKVTMTGDTFEMEDQRNWTDASFKTYSTPLDIPFPVRLEKGELIEQSVTIELNGFPPQEFGETKYTGGNSTRHPLPKESRFDIDWKKPVRRPKIGFQLPSGLHPPAETVLDSLRSIRPDHVRCDLRLTQNNWRAELTRGIAISNAIEAQLELALFVESVSSNAWQEFLSCIQTFRTRIARVLLFHTQSKSTPSDLVEPAYQALKGVAPKIQFVVGTNAYFAELNRERPTWIPEGQVCYSINPQVHAFDNLSLCETFSAQRETVNTAVNLFNCDVVISPVTLRPRFNPNATSSADLETQLLASIDRRQSNGFGAAWTVGMLSSLLTHPRVQSATVFEAFGLRGIMGLDGKAFRMTPLFAHVLRCKHLFFGSSTLPLEVVALGIESESEQKYLVCGNLSSMDRTVGFKAPTGDVREVTIPSESVEIVLMEDFARA